MAGGAQKVAVVTGASSGIGRATVGLLRDAGFRVFGSSRRSDGGGAADGIEWVPIDVGSDRSVEDGVAEILARAGRVDVLVNNAGFTVVGGAEESSGRQAQEVFETNFFGAVRMIRAVLPGMRARRSGRIVNVSSVLGFLPAPYMALYSGSKHAMHGYSHSLDHEVREFGIRVAIVEPAYTATGFGRNSVAADARQDDYERGRGRAVRLLDRVMKTADAPEAVAGTILDAATRASPRVRNPSGAFARRLTLLARFAPATLLDYGLRRQAGLG